MTLVEEVETLLRGKDLGSITGGLTFNELTARFPDYEWDEEMLYDLADAINRRGLVNGWNIVVESRFLTKSEERRIAGGPWQPKEGESKRKVRALTGGSSKRGPRDREELGRRDQDELRVLRKEIEFSHAEAAALSGYISHHGSSGLFFARVTNNSERLLSLINDALKEASR